MRKLTKTQLVGVVSDLLAMAARQEYERERRFEAATATAKARRAREAAERAAARRDANRKEQHAASAARRRVESAAATVIQRHFRGHAARRRHDHRRIARLSYAEDLARCADRAAEATRRDAAAVVIQAAVRARACLLSTSPSPRDATLSRMPSSA